MDDDVLDTLVIDDQPVTEAEEAETTEEVVEAPAEEEEARVEFTPEQQAKVDEIARKAAARNLEKLQEAQARAEEAEERLQRLTPRQEQPQGRPPVPPMPDPFEDQFEAKMAARDAALEQAARWDTFQAMSQYQQQQAQRSAQQAQENALRETVDSYNARASRLGIKSDELQAAGRQIAAIGMPEALVEHILHDSHGPAVTVYLGNHLDELDKVRAMSPIKAAIYIEQEIKPKAGKPKKAPPPTLDPVRGSGAPEGKLGGKGLVIE
jgi:hypothetical protein